jgi:hypothetical protein
VLKANRKLVSLRPSRLDGLPVVSSVLCPHYHRTAENQAESIVGVQLPGTKSACIRIALRDILYHDTKILSKHCPIHETYVGSSGLGHYEDVSTASCRKGNVGGSGRRINAQRMLSEIPPPPESCPYKAHRALLAEARMPERPRQPHERYAASCDRSQIALFEWAPLQHVSGFEALVAVNTFPPLWYIWKGQERDIDSRDKWSLPSLGNSRACDIQSFVLRSMHGAVVQPRTTRRRYRCRGRLHVHLGDLG